MEDKKNTWGEVDGMYTPWLPRLREKASQPSPQQFAEALELQLQNEEVHHALRDCVWSMKHHEDGMRHARRLAVAYRERLGVREGMEAIVFAGAPELKARLECGLLEAEVSAEFHLTRLKEEGERYELLRLDALRAQAAYEVWQGTKYLRTAENSYVDGLKAVDLELTTRSVARRPRPKDVDGELSREEMVAEEIK